MARRPVPDRGWVDFSSNVNNSGSEQTKLHLPVPVADFAQRLLAWYRLARRDLPWRDNPTPYRVWLSEVMLQQTQVKTALPYFQRFIDAYPSIQELAEADEQRLLSLWAGLGYYSRARNLLKAARQVVERHGGRFPEDWRSARQLPGVGRYTAGAVLSIAFGQPHPILDGNIRRFLSRFLRHEPDSPAGLERFWTLLTEIVADPTVAPVVSDFNQALMELGALVCTPRVPECHRCPLAGCCGARLAGVEREIPKSRAQRSSESLEFVAAVVSKDGKFLMRQSSQTPFLKGFWEFPRVEGKPRPGIDAVFRAQLGLFLKVVRECSPVRHQITFRKLRFYPLICDLEEEPEPSEWTWMSIGRPGFPVSSYMLKIVRRVSATA